MQYVSSLILPSILFFVGILFLCDKNGFEIFLQGAKNGFNTAISLLPTLVLLLSAIGMFTSSGAVDLLCKLLSPIAERLAIPQEILPLLLLRPVSGSGSMAMASELFKKYTADSFSCLCACVIMGSSDTMLYVISVYFSSVGIKRTRHTLICAFLTMIFCIFISCFVCRIFFT